MASDNRVLNWLYSILTNEYHYIHETYNDISRVLGTTASLLPRTEVYTSHDGVSKLLLCLSGTLPIEFLGISYQFPIKIWIPHVFPRQPPLVYVTPREGMIVRPGQHVDPQGQVYHPYLSHWVKFWDKSTLVDLIAILTDIFTKEPPVITTQQEDKFISTKEQTQAKSGPRDSYYHEDDPGSHTLSIPSISPPPPPLPPRAGLPLNSPCPSAADNQLQPPPLPPKTGLDHDQQYRALRSHGEMLNEPNSHSIQVQLLSEARNSGQHYHTKLLPASDFSPVMTGSYEQHHAPHVVTNVTTGELSRQGPPWQMSTTHLIDEPGHIDGARKPTAPPVPPNPHKQSLIQKVLEKKAVIRRSDAKQENSTLHGIAAQREAMLACEKELQAEMQTLSRLSSILESNTSILHHALEQADITISNSQNHPPPDIDDLLVAPTVVANQLYSLVADDRAIEDTVFFISRSLEKGSISVSTFVKSTRTISREWFLKKALIQKISVGMGLVCTSR